MKIGQLKYINIHTHHFVSHDDVMAIVDVSNELHTDFSSNHFFSVGIHPWFLSSENSDAKIHKLEKTLQRGIFAIGEVGFDSLRGADLALQKKAFVQVCALSEQYAKPLIIHCVKAWDLLLQMQKQLCPQQTWIIHGFRGSLGLAQQLLRNNFYLSFGVDLMINIDLQNVFATLPSERIFLETDDADISIQQVYQSAKNIKNIDIEILKKIIFENFQTVFCLRKK